MKLADLITGQATRRGDAPALRAPGRDDLSYAALDRLVSTLSDQLTGRGRVGLVLPNGPESAVAFLAAASAGGAVPLNPTLGEHESADGLSRFGAGSLVTLPGESAARAAATRLGLPVIDLVADPDGPAGTCDLAIPRRETGNNSRFLTAGRGDVALVLGTSGTTGPPKVVPLTHANLLASAANIAATLELTDRDVVLEVMPLFHIHGLVAAVLAPLSSGGVIACAPAFDPARVLHWMAETGATWVTAVPTMHAALLASAAADAGAARAASERLRFLRSGSASLAPTRLAELEDTFGVPVLENYGMTEAAHQITSNRAADRRPGTVGRAAGPKVKVVDEHGEPVPAGARGEVVIRGDNVITAYEAEPDVNAAAFFDGWFRTGDEGVLDDDGVLTLTGRLKELINRGGEKVAPREIDEILLDHHAVAEAVAFAVPHPTLGEEVAAAAVLRPGATATEADLTAWAAARLAPFKRPRRVLVVDELPKGPTGKLQRIGLAEQLGLGERAPTSHGRVPATPVEAALAGLWAGVLGVDRVGVDEDFFLLGGDSLRAMQLVAQVADALGVDCDPARLLDFATVESMAAEIESIRARPRPPVVEPARDPSATSPLSLAQEGFWFLSRLEPDNPSFNGSVGIQLSGPLDVDAVRTALDGLAARHETLRTVFPEIDGRPVAMVGPPAPVALTVADGDTGADGDGRQLAAAFIRQPFDVRQGPLFRAALLRLAPDRHLLVLALHHLVSDAWSRRVLLADLGALASGAALEPLPIRYADHARDTRHPPDDDLAWWTAQFASLPPALDLPTDRPLPPVQGFDGDQLRRRVPEGVGERLAATGRALGATPFMTLLAAYAALLHRHTGQDEVVVGCPIAGRTSTKVEPLIGVFTNTLAIRIDCSGDPTFADLVGRVRAFCLEAYRHAALPFSRLVEALNPPRDRRYPPIIQTMFQLRDVANEPFELGGALAVPVLLGAGTARNHFELEVHDDGDGQELVFAYGTDVFDRSTIDAIADRMLTLMSDAAARPDVPIGRLALLPDTERERLLAWSTATATAAAAAVGPAPSTPGRTVPDLVMDQVARTPDAVAVVDGSSTLTYRDLAARSGGLAARLVDAGVAPGTIVALACRRSAEMVVGLLGILRAGGAYLPLDPAYPRDRLRLMADDARPAVAVADEWSQGAVPAGLAVVPVTDPGDAGRVAPDIASDPRRLAYVLYTSGSTGAPKGVLVEHAGVVAVIEWGARTFAPDELAVTLASTSISFDISAFELFMPLATGGAVHVVADASALSRLGDAAGITLVNTVPSVMAEVLSAGPLPATVRTVCLAGEALPATVAHDTYAADGVTRVWNLYGPTEDTIYSTGLLVDRDDGGPPTIGHPVAGGVALVLDRHGELCPVGIPGEIHLGGPGVARGYLGRPELTAERFVPHPRAPGPSGRLYRTGDRGRWLPSRELEYLGREDDQVKLRGHRIELGEIETCLAGHPAVAQAVAGVRELRAGDRRLVAWIVPTGADGPSPAELRAHVAERLPRACVPSAFVPIESVPRTPNGKTDRAALPDPPTAPAGVPERHADPIARSLSWIWQDVLGIARMPRRHDDFFDLGGHSLLAVRMLAEVERAFGVALPLGVLFEHPTIDGLAALVRSGDAVAPATLGVHVSGTRPPLFCMHAWPGAGNAYRRLAPGLGADQPLYYVQADRAVADFKPGTTIEDMARPVIDEIKAVQPAGPYFLGGQSAGGLLAYEAAGQLTAAGEPVALVALFDTAPIEGERGSIRSLVARIADRTASENARAAMNLLDIGRRLGGRAARGRPGPGARMAGGARPDRAVRAAGVVADIAVLKYRPRPYDGLVVLFRCPPSKRWRRDAAKGWRPLVPRLEVIDVAGDHLTLMREPHNGVLVAELADVLTKAQAAVTS
ncbi:MAG: non-ribosomal peptide synthetase [Acidimicrobiales bacterium]|nr:non-ribosomal peptide synthetase [Acidimicrobiales bacterium]